MAQVADIIGATLHNVDPEARTNATVFYDSRTVEAGGLFLALPGERVHGSEFAHAAIERGAVAVISATELAVPCLVVPVSRQVNSPQGTGIHALSGTITHEHTAPLLAALAALAGYVHRYYAAEGLVTIAITGSMGKTTTKDYCAAVLSNSYGADAVLAASGSLNNEIGVPWLATQLTAQHRFFVVEMGARHKGDITYLASIVVPDVAVVLNVGSAHVGEFGSLDNIAAAKGELIGALPATACAVINADDPRVRAMSTLGRTITCGRSVQAQFRYEVAGLNSEAEPLVVVTTSPDAEFSFTAHIAGEHLVSGIVMALAACYAAGVPIAKLAHYAGQVVIPGKHRMEVVRTRSGPIVIDDTYNSNPEAVKAALKTLVELARLTPSSSQGQTWAVLGLMGELGEGSVAMHDAVGRFVVRLNVSHLLCVGTSREVEAMYRGAVMEGSNENQALLVGSVREASTILNERIGSGDVVLVKASHSQELWRVVDDVVGFLGGSHS